MVNNQNNHKEKIICDFDDDCVPDFIRNKVKFDPKFDASKSLREIIQMRFNKDMPIAGGKGESLEDAIIILVDDNKTFGKLREIISEYILKIQGIAKEKLIHIGSEKGVSSITYRTSGYVNNPNCIDKTFYFRKNCEMQDKENIFNQKKDSKNIVAKMEDFNYWVDNHKVKASLIFAILLLIIVIPIGFIRGTLDTSLLLLSVSVSPITGLILYYLFFMFFIYFPIKALYEKDISSFVLIFLVTWLPIILLVGFKGDLLSNSNNKLKSTTFNGYECTDDCSGHEAGYYWAEEKGIHDSEDCGGNSQSFIEGCMSFADGYRIEEYTPELEQCSPIVGCY